MTTATATDGLVETRRSRQTGHMVSIYDGRLSGMDTEPGRWSTVCEQHGGICAHRTLKIAREWLAEPAMWCEECQIEVRGPGRCDDPRLGVLAEALAALDLVRARLSYQEQAAFVSDRLCREDRIICLDDWLAKLDAAGGWSKWVYDEQAAYVLNKA